MAAQGCVKEEDGRPRRRARAAALPTLRRARSSARAATVRCAAGHSFDVARQGYLSLLPAACAPAGDSRGHGRRARALPRPPATSSRSPRALGRSCSSTSSTAPAPSSTSGPAPAGTSRALLDRFPAAAGLALDVSKPALRRAARAHPRAAAVGCDAWGPLPLRDGVADAVLNVFAPRNAAEIARVLRPDGARADRDAGAGHLRGAGRPARPARRRPGQGGAPGGPARRRARAGRAARPAMAASAWIARAPAPPPRWARAPSTSRRRSSTSASPRFLSRST